MVDVVTLGESMARLTASGVGPLRHAATLRLGIAGAESNVAIGLARLGMGATWLGRVGDDEFGRLIVATLRGEGVDTRAIVDPAAPTALLVKERRNTATTAISYYRTRSAGSRLRPDDLDPDTIAQATVLHLTGITPALSTTARATVERAVDIARDAGTAVSLDVNYRSALWSAATARRFLLPLSAHVDVLIAGTAEARLLVGDVADEALLEALAALGPDEVVVKRGARGASALIDGMVFDAPPVQANEVDPVGAGDAFTAGFLAERVAGRAPEHRLATAARCGAAVVASEGDWEGAPARDELASAIADETDVRR